MRRDGGGWSCAVAPAAPLARYRCAVYVVEETLDCGRGSLVWKDVTVTKVNSCVPRSQVYPIFCRTPLKYPLKTFDLCVGMVVVSNARLF